MFVVAFVVFALATAIRWTLLDPRWHQSVLEDVGAYERVYDEVLVDPELAEITSDLLSNLPVDRSVVDANLRLVVPIATLRSTVERTSVSITEYLRKRRDDVDAVYLLDPIRSRLQELETALVADLVRSLEPSFVDALEEFEVKLDALVDDVRAGIRPTQFPDITVVEPLVEPLTAVILHGVPEVTPALRVQVEALVRVGDINGALALAVPHYDADRPLNAFRDLESRVGSSRYDFAADTVAREQDRVLDAVRGFRGIAGDILPAITVVAVAMAAIALSGLAWTARSSIAGAARILALVLAVGAAALAGTWFAIRLALGDPFTGLTHPESGLPASVRALMGDIGRRARGSFEATILDVVVVTLVGSALVIVVGIALPALLALTASPRGRRLVGAAAVAGAIAAWVGSGALVRSGGAEATRLVCNGREDLCDRPLDEVAFVMSHNAMAASELGWISANQDLSLRAQLDMGVRGLMLDWWYWEDTDRFTELADGADLPPEYVAFLSRLLAEHFVPRPGTFLCHAICRLGSTPLVDGLRDIRRWLDENPNEVLVIIAQDEIDPDDGVAAMRAAGLDEYAFVPPRTLSATWPTLRQLIDSGKRLVLFVERADKAPAPWYTNAYDYMMETPYTFRGPTEMSCEPFRGGRGKPLFLLNHWIQRAAPSRVDAGTVNEADFIVDRARRCAKERGALPNFIAVDFVNVGDVFGATNRINDLMRSEPHDPPRRARAASPVHPRPLQPRHAYHAAGRPRSRFAVVRPADVNPRPSERNGPGQPS